MAKVGILSETAYEVLGITAWSLDYKGAADEQTGMDSSGNKTFLAGLTEWSGSFNGFWDSDETDILGDPPLLNVSDTIELVLELTTGVTYAGDAIVTGFKPEVSVDGVAKMSVEFQGTSTLT